MAGYPPAPGEWYHVTKHALPKGTVLHPGGGQSQWSDYYQEIGEPERASHVWLDNDHERVGYWIAQHSHDGGDVHVYQVDPHSTPRQYDPADPMDGHVTTGATVVREVDPDYFTDDW